MFTQQDDGRAPGVVSVNESMARQYGPKGDPVGERITLFKGNGPNMKSLHARLSAWWRTSEIMLLAATPNQWYTCPWRS